MDENINETQGQCTIHSVSGNCFWRHKWTKWQQYRQPLIDRRTGKSTYENRQRRLCLRCGKMQDEWVS